MITFNVENYKSRLSHQLAFQIVTRVVGRKVHHIVLDEGASTLVLSMSCWRAIGSHELNKSPQPLKSFNERGFQPHAILLPLSIELEGRTISIQVEVVDAPSDYNFLLGRNWFYAMTVIASSVFCMLQFPNEGKIVTIDKLDYCFPNITITKENSFPMLGKSPPPINL